MDQRIKKDTAVYKQKDRILILSKQVTKMKLMSQESSM